MNFDSTMLTDIHRGEQANTRTENKQANKARIKRDKKTINVNEHIGL